MNKWVLLLCGMLTACSAPQTKTTEGKDYYQIELGPLIAKGEPEDISIHEWGKNVRFIPLETNASIQIKFINKIILKEDKLLIIHLNRASMFDLNGKYLYDIGQNEEGETEYSRLYSLILRNDTIFIRDNYNFKLFNWQGKLLGEMPAPKQRRMLDFYALPNSDVLLGHIDNLSGQNTKRLAFFRDTTILKLIPNLTKYEKITDNMAWVYEPEMKAFDGTVSAFKELFNDTIFQVDPDYTLRPYAVINLGKYKAEEGFRFSLTPEMIFEKGFDIFDGKIALTAIGEKDNIIYLAHHYKGEHYIVDNPYTFSYDKKSGQGYYQKIIYPEYQYEFKEKSSFVPHFISTDGKYLIDFEQTKNESNPIIVLVER